MKLLITAVLVVGVITASMLSYPNSEQANQSATDAGTKQQETLDEYIELMEMRNDALRKLIELKELERKLQTGKAWSARGGFLWKIKLNSIGPKLVIWHPRSFALLLKFKAL